MTLLQNEDSTLRLCKIQGSNHHYRIVVLHGNHWDEPVIFDFTRVNAEADARTAFFILATARQQSVMKRDRMTVR